MLQEPENTTEVGMENYYDILGVSPDASKAEIERAYKRLSKAYHPDAGATNDHMFKKIHDIYKLLMDNEARASYNREYASAAAEEEKAEAKLAAARVRAAEAKYGETPAGRGTGRARARAADEDWGPLKAAKPDAFALLRQADEYLEKGSWKRADDTYAMVLKQKPKDPRAWLGRLLASVRVKEKAELANVQKTFEKNEYYLGCQKVAGKMLKEELEGYLETAVNRILSEKYDAAVAKMKGCDSPKSWQQVASSFRSLGGFRDSETLAKRCSAKAEGVKSDDIYNRGVYLMNQGDAQSLVDAVGIFQKVPDWKDAEDQIQECYRLLAELKAKEADRPYQNALEAMKSAESMQDYSRAAELFEALGDYRDAKKKARACRRNAESSRLDVLYRKALENMTGDRIASYEDAIEMFKELDGWKDSEEQISQCQKMILQLKRDRYAKAAETLENAKEVQDYLQASTLFAGIAGYRDAKKQAENCKKEAAYVSGMKKMEEIGEKIPDHPQRLGRVYFLDQLTSCNDALELFSEIPDWKDAGERAEICRERAEELRKLIPKIPEKRRGISRTAIGIIAGGAIALMGAGAFLISRLT